MAEREGLSALSLKGPENKGLSAASVVVFVPPLRTSVHIDPKRETRRSR